MGCCLSHIEKETVYEVTLDADGVAHRVPKGEGTHYIHVSKNSETHMEEKTDINSSQKDGQWPSLTKPAPYNKRVHPTTGENQTEEKPSS